MAAAKPTYDLMLLLDSGAPDEQRSKILADAERLITSNGGEITSKHDWGVRSLAYEIKHKPDADYHLLQFQGLPAALDALNRTLHITDGVTRYRIIKLRPGTPPAPDVRQEVPAARPTEESADEAPPAADPAPAA
jgi:small subunit ribosomal protein S6